LEPEADTVSKLLQSWRAGEKTALDQLTPLVYNELRKLAAAYLRRERLDHTLQPTALVHEAWIRLAGQNRTEIENRAHFFAIAANLMRQILVNHARRRDAVKRGGGVEQALVEDLAAAQPCAVDLIALDQALNWLAELCPRQSRIVELRFFGGLTEEEIGDVLDISVVTVKRDWRIARAALYGQLNPRAGGTGLS